MPKPIAGGVNQSTMAPDLFGSLVLRGLPLLVVFYVLLVLPFLSDEGRGVRLENIVFWPSAALLTILLVLRNAPFVDKDFFLSLPIMSLFAYLVFSAASVTWALSPDFALTRLAVQVLAVIVVVLPFALPIPTKNTITAVMFCYLLAFAVSAVFVLTTPASSIGHFGYFYHKQELGFLGAAGVILGIHHFLRRGWLKLVAPLAVGTGLWLVFESQSKSALAFALVALVASGIMLLICARTRLTPAIIVAAIVIASLFVSNPLSRLAWRFNGDPTITGRTGIWAYANLQIAQRPWLGWGFHSYHGVPNSPQKGAPGYVRDMPSSHSGYLELKLETGWIGYWIFLVFIYSSLHLLERVRRQAPLRAWCYLSIELFALLINLTDSAWLVLDSLWILYLFTVADSVRFSLSNKVPDPKPAPVKAPRYPFPRRVAKAPRPEPQLRAE